MVCGDWISDARTGAQPAIAMKYLAAKSDIITVIGAGRQFFCLISKNTGFFLTKFDIRIIMNI